jgi:hypothetical protein
MESQTLPRDTLLFRALEYGFNKEIFNFKMLVEELKLSDEESEYLRTFIHSGIEGAAPSHIFVTVSTRTTDGKTGNTFFAERILRLLPHAYFQYIEIIELQESLKTSKESKILSLIAIGTALMACFLQPMLSYFLTLKG